MSQESAAAKIETEQPSPPPPELSRARPEFTLRAVVVGAMVAGFVGAAYPYVVLKIGFGPNISVVSAFLGFILIGIVGWVGTKLLGHDVKGNRFEYNIVQTAGTCAGEMGFMCIVLAAFDMLAGKPSLGVQIHLNTLQIFLWLTLAGMLGILLAVPLRRHYIDEEKLTFADGVAAGETLLVLDSDPRRAKKRVAFLSIGALASGVVTWLRDAWHWFPENWFFWPAAQSLNVGMNWSLLSIGSGLLVGIRINLSMFLGMVLAWYIGPWLLIDHGWITGTTYPLTLRWVMWPATGLMVAGGLTALLVKWRLIARTFQGLRVGNDGGTDFPIRWVLIGSSLLAVALITFQKIELGMPIWISAIAVGISFPLMLVGTRVLGETNWAPISQLGNLVQGIFALLTPGNIAVNMVASGMSSTIGANGEHLMQDYKAGKLIGSNNRYLTYMQLMAAPIGAIAVALAYPLLRNQYGIGAERIGIDPRLAGNGEIGLTAPSAVRWANFAELLAHGVDQLPPHALQALIIGAVVGVAITLLETKYHRFLPSPTGVGLGMLVAPNYVLPMVLGGVIQWTWQKWNARSEEEFNTPLASGFIVGEALLALVIPILFYLGFLKGS